MRLTWCVHRYPFCFVRLNTNGEGHGSTNHSYLRPMRQELRGRPDWARTEVLPTSLPNGDLRQAKRGGRPSVDNRQRALIWGVLQDAGVIPADKVLPMRKREDAA